MALASVLVKEHSVVLWLPGNAILNVYGIGVVVTELVVTIALCDHGKSQTSPGGTIRGAGPYQRQLVQNS
jgi:hypothetical protein